MRQTIDANPREPLDAKMRTIHVWMVPEPEEEEEPEKQERFRLPGWRDIGQCAIQLLALLLLAVICTAESSPAYAIRTIHVRAILLPVQIVQANVAIIPTGERTIPATRARGWLTITNGSSIIETLPAGFTVASASGAQISIDQAVTVPASNGETFGRAIAAAHAVQPGAAGNIAALSVDVTEGTSLYLKNLTAFSGGRDARTERYATRADTDNALAAARSKAKQEIAATHHGVLVKCTETVQLETTRATVSWACQYATYNVPAGVQVLSASVQGPSVVLRVREVVLPQ
jgi:hypothetical protein